MNNLQNQIGPQQQECAGSQFRVVIVGGGPGGLFSAWHLAAKAGNACKITILEASNRLGGKIKTRSFGGAGLYEAGVAEIYDYSGLGPDPLRELIEKDLGLEIQHISGGACVLDGKILPDADALAEHFGTATRDAAAAFRARCAELLSPSAFYKCARDADNAHPWMKIPGEEILNTEIPDATARRYIRVMTHSDVAAPPHLTNGLNFLKNSLMDVDGYMNVYSVVGGNEKIAQRLTEEIDADVRLNMPVRSVEALADKTYRLEAGNGASAETFIADYVILALPLTALSIMDWRTPALHHAIVDHVRHFDRPGHYLRATLLFERPFWRDKLPGAWWMLDAFDGCCVYDEGARHDLGQWGALGFLIAGNAALGLANISDDEIEQLCLEALPAELGDARSLLADRRIHRWMASVNAIPGGTPVRKLRENHRPDPVRLPGVMMVGDYIFDATLNGVLDSADAATEMIIADVMERRRADHSASVTAATASGHVIGQIGKDLQNDAWSHAFDASFLADLLKIVWKQEQGARILVAGSGAGTTVAALRNFGFDAYGIEADLVTHRQTPIELRAYNLHGDLTDLPFETGRFDVVLEACLCQVPRNCIGGVATELRRVARHGVFLGSVASDLAIELVERHDLLARVATFTSRWEWSELLLGSGFDFALTDPMHLEKAWQRALIEQSGPGKWYEDAEGLLYCCYVAANPVVEEVQQQMIAAE